MTDIDNGFKTFWGWSVCGVSRAWRKNIEGRKPEAHRPQGGTVAGGLSDQMIGRHLGELRIRGPSAGMSSIMPVDDADGSHQRPTSVAFPFPEDLEM